MTDITALAKEAEAYETPQWAVEAILDREILTREVVDPCAGKGVMCDVAGDLGYTVFEFDKYDWWGARRGVITDFLLDDNQYLPSTVANNTVLMNPPFSLAVEFVKRCFELKARKIVCFQRFAWWEAETRREFWKEYPPARIYICGSRATCWRYDIPSDSNGNRFDRKTGKKLGNTPTAHAWFVWERGHPAGSPLGHIYKEAAE